jgi:hypothetical protein
VTTAKVHEILLSKYFVGELQMQFIRVVMSRHADATPEWVMRPSLLM